MVCSTRTEPRSATTSSAVYSRRMPDQRASSPHSSSMSRTCRAKSIDVMTPLQKCPRSEEHTSELQSQSNLVCRLLLEKKKIFLGQAIQCHAHLFLVRFR